MFGAVASPDNDVGLPPRRAATSESFEDPPLPKALILFSGHNNRAVIALARAMKARNLPFFLVARAEDSFSDGTPFADLICHRRMDDSVSLDLFRDIRDAVRFDGELVYCPTTEFINSFVLSHRDAVCRAGFEVPLPSLQLYNSLTSKFDSPTYVQELCGIPSPRFLDWDTAQSPCVFKPRQNIDRGIGLYPRICMSEEQVQISKAELSPQKWFVQEFVNGQSYYFCSYIARDGETATYWQANLLQQPAGKSIVLARSSPNPGLPEERLVSGLVRLGYCGPIMIEVLQVAPSMFYYIETNPRFWGPLQLAATACPRLFDLFASDIGLAPRHSFAKPSRVKETAWYAWQDGAKQKSLKRYPAADSLTDECIERLLSEHDVYSDN